MKILETALYIKAHHRKARSRCFMCEQSWPCDAYQLAEEVMGYVESARCGLHVSRMVARTARPPQVR